MNIELAEYLKLFIALIAIIDIPGNIPVFLQQTQRLDFAARVIAAATAGIATGIILFAFAMYGDVILDAFGITISAFRILGGLVVLLIALDMLGLVRTSAVAADPDDPEANHPVAIGIFPMAVPLFAGPGAITAVMIYAHQEFHSDHDLIVTVLIVSAATAVAVGLSFASVLARWIGPTTQVVLNRLLGMIVGALGVEFILEGIQDFFPSL